MPSRKKPLRVDSKISNRRQSSSKNNPCALDRAKRAKIQKTSIVKETVNSGDMEKMKTQKSFSSWSKENKPRWK
jgi:hypothetical protein